MKDNANPTFNEDIYFRMPIKVREKTFDDIINNTSDEELLVDAIREELRARPDITLQLWLDG